MGAITEEEEANKGGQMSNQRETASFFFFYYYSSGRSCCCFVVFQLLLHMLHRPSLALTVSHRCSPGSLSFFYDRMFVSLWTMRFFVMDLVVVCVCLQQMLRD